jgi:hypothetical protein
VGEEIGVDFVAGFKGEACKRWVWHCDLDWKSIWKILGGFGGAIIGFRLQPNRCSSRLPSLALLDVEVD